MKIQSTPLTFIDQTDSRKLEVYIKSNLPTMQIYNSNTGAYTPDWREGEKLTLTTDVFLDSRVMTTEEYSSTLIKWYIDEVSDSTEITSNRNLKTLQITTNELATSPIITYICEATYQGIIASMRLTFTRVDTGLNGEAGADGTSVRILGTADSVALISGTNYYTITYSAGTVVAAELGDAYIYNGELYVCSVLNGDGTTDYFVNVGSIQGPKGEDAKSIVLSGNSQTFKISKTNVITPSTITVVAQVSNTSITSWSYSVNGGQTFLSTIPSGVVRDGSIVTITGSTLSTNSLVIKASDGTIEDVFTVYKVSDGTDGSDGDKGDPAPLAFLTNENISFAADENGQVPLTTFTTNIVAYVGTTKVTPTISAINNLPSGTTVVPNKGMAYSNITPAIGNLTVADLYTSSSLTTKVDKTKLSNGDSFVVGNYLYIYNSTNSNFKCQTIINTDGVEQPSTFVVNNEITLTFSIANNSTLGSANSNSGIITIPVTSPVSTNLKLSWSKINTGHTGVGVSSTTVSYGVSDAASTQPTEWQSTIPTVADGKYLWTRTIIDYTDASKAGTVTYTYAKQGEKGATGSSGSSVTVSSIQYQAGTSATTAPTGTWSNAVVAVADGSYLWTKTTFSDGKIAYGVAKQGGTGRGISKVTEYYLATTASSGVTISTSGWTNTIQTIDSSKRYLWNYETITYTDNTTSSTNPIIIGVFGNTGATGAQGKGITSIKEYYLASPSASGITISTSGWKDTMQQITATNKYLWNYEQITYTDDSVANMTPVIIGAYGDKGDKGDQGVQGPKGDNGQQLYTWVKYADTPTSGMSDNPSGKTYIGLAYNKTTATESTTYSDYLWSLIKGETGAAGPKGADGQQYYTWIKYADSDTGANMSDSPDGKLYIGLAYNKTTSTESSTASDYTWALFKGEQGATGPTGENAVTFQVFSNNGYALSTSVPTISLQTFAYIGDVEITAGAAYQWYRHNNTDWVAISGATNDYFNVSRDDVAFSNNYMCVMQFNGTEYKSSVTIDDKNDENKVFASKPSNYFAGDLWVVGTDYVPSGYTVGTMLRAEHTNSTYTDSDWVPATKYDDEIEALKSTVDSYKQYFSVNSSNGFQIGNSSINNDILTINRVDAMTVNADAANVETLDVTGRYSGSTMLQAPIINLGNFSIVVESNGSLSIVANT